MSTIHRNNIHEWLGVGYVGGPGDMFTSSGPHGETSAQAQQRAAQPRPASSITGDNAIPEDPDTQAGQQGAMPTAQLIGPDFEAAADGAMADAKRDAAATHPAPSPASGPELIPAPVPSAHKTNATPILIGVAALLVSKALKWW